MNPFDLGIECDGNICFSFYNLLFVFSRKNPFDELLLLAILCVDYPSPPHSDLDCSPLTLESLLIVLPIHPVINYSLESLTCECKEVIK